MYNSVLFIIIFKVILVVELEEKNSSTRSSNIKEKMIMVDDDENFNYLLISEIEKGTRNKRFVENLKIDSTRNPTTKHIALAK